MNTMSKTREIRVPDIGDFDKVPIIEVLVAQGDEIEAEQALITLESEKATLDVPSPVAGHLVELKVAEGDEVGQGDLDGIVELSDQAAEADSGSDSRDDERDAPAEDGTQNAERAAPKE